LFIHYYVIV